MPRSFPRPKGLFLHLGAEGTQVKKRRATISRPLPFGLGQKEESAKPVANNGRSRSPLEKQICFFSKCA